MEGVDDCHQQSDVAAFQVCQVREGRILGVDWQGEEVFVESFCGFFFPSMGSLVDWVAIFKERLT